MAPQLGLGIMLVFLGGILNGSFAAPMKRLSGWRWENIWLLYAITGLVVFPWLTAFATVPHLVGVLAQASGAVLGKVAFFGFAWGIGAVLFGQGIARVGLALGFSIILGISGSFGSLLPMAILHPEQLTTRPGIALIVGTVIMAIGLAFLALAGQRRERERAPAAVGEQRPGFGLGLIICILSGLFSSLLNFTFVFGAEITDISLRAGASQVMAGNGIWAGGKLRFPTQCGLLHLSLEQEPHLGRLPGKRRGFGLYAGRHVHGISLVRWCRGLRYGRGCTGHAGRNHWLARLHVRGYHHRRGVGILGPRVERRQPRCPHLLPYRDRHPFRLHRCDQLRQCLLTRSPSPVFAGVADGTSRHRRRGESGNREQN